MVERINPILVALALVACGGEVDGDLRDADAPVDASQVGDAGSADDAGRRDAGALDDAAVDAGAGCGDGELDPGETCDDGDDDRFDGCLPDCTAVEPIDTPERVWTWVEVPGTRCMDGSPAGFGVSRVEGATDLMIYLEGGGACFTDACDFMAFSVPFIPPPDGIFNRLNPANPVRDWSMIYVPYCTGDLHAGGRETELAGATRHFMGYRNISTFLERWVPSFPEADRVLVTGISAGGYGAGMNIGQITHAFGPERQMVLIDDSGPPFSNAVIPPCLLDTFRRVWGLDDTVLAECGAYCADTDDWASGLLRYMSEGLPSNVRVGLFSNTADTVIRGFLGEGWGDGTYDNCEGTPRSVPQDVYEADLLRIRDTYRDRAATYYIGTSRVLNGFGAGHTALRSSTFWATSIDGTPLSEWVGDVIDGEVRHIGP